MRPCLWRRRSLVCVLREHGGSKDGEPCAQAQEAARAGVEALWSATNGSSRRRSGRETVIEIPCAYPRLARARPKRIPKDSNARSYTLVYDSCGEMDVCGEALI